MNISEQDVTIRLQHELDELGEYNALTSIDVDILVHGKSAGKIHGTIVNRNAIPDRAFYSVMDGRSADLQYVAVNLFEPRYGRTKLQSLHEKGDDMEFDFLYISYLKVNKEYATNGSSDVGAYALRKLLHDPYIRGPAARYDMWGTSSCIYILDTTTPEIMRFNFFATDFFRIELS